MAKFSLQISGSDDVDLTERIDVYVDTDTFKTLRSIIKNFLKEKKYL